MHQTWTPHFGESDLELCSKSSKVGVPLVIIHASDGAHEINQPAGPMTLETSICQRFNNG